MRHRTFVVAVLAAAAIAVVANGAEAGQRHGAPGGRAAVRGGSHVTAGRPVVVVPRVVGVAPYRPYFYGYRPGLSVGFYAGYPYGYYPYGWGYPLPPASYLSLRPGVAYGGVRIEGAPRDAQVFADGYYVGIVDDFDGAFQHLNLPAGPHHIEVRAAGHPPIAFDVRVQPGDTLTYHADAW